MAKHISETGKSGFLNDCLKDSPLSSPQGGAFAYTPTREIILESGFSIWLKVNRETLIRRVSKRPEKRPLLAKGNIEQTISRLMEERYPVYAEADIMVESDDGKRPQTVKVISEILANQGILNRSDET